MDPIREIESKRQIAWRIVMVLIAIPIVIVVLVLTGKESNIPLFTLIGLVGIYFAGSMLISSKTAKMRMCPKCDRPDGRVIESITVEAADLQKEGKGVHKCRCEKCGHEWEEEYVIDALVHAADDDDDDRGGHHGHGGGGSWGGGSSSGGGAGRSF